MFDCIVVGAGTCGLRSRHDVGAVRQRVLLITGNVDRIGHLSCNPAIGGLAKGHMVREIDALGGMMGLWADRAGIQFRTLNASKGPAVRATRAQIDRDSYMEAAKAALFAEPDITIWQDTVDEVLERGGRAAGVRTELGQTFEAPHVIRTTGTFLWRAHPRGAHAFSRRAPRRCRRHEAFGFAAEARPHPGPPQDRDHPALLRSSIDFFANGGTARGRSGSGLQLLRAKARTEPQVPCYVTWTNERTHGRHPIGHGPLAAVHGRH